MTIGVQTQKKGHIMPWKKLNKSYSQMSPSFHYKESVVSKVREIESSPSPPNWGNGKWASEWTQFCCLKVPFLFVWLFEWMDGRSCEYNFTTPTIDRPIILGLNQCPRNNIFICDQSERDRIPVFSTKLRKWKMVIRLNEILLFKAILEN